MLLRRIAGFAVAVGALPLAVAAPLQAQAELNWTDPAGDATGLLGESSTPRPSDPELDILEARYGFSGANFVAFARVERIGLSAGSQATAFRFHFRSGKDRYYLQSVFASSPQYLDLFMEGGMPALYRVTEAGTEALECACSGRFDFKQSTATFSLTKQSLARALNTPVGQIDLRELSVETLAHQVANYSSVDQAPAPEGSALRH